MMKMLLVSAILLAYIAFNQGMHLNGKSYPDVQTSSKSAATNAKKGLYKFQMSGRTDHYVSEDFGLTWTYYTNNNVDTTFYLVQRLTTNGGLQFMIKRTNTDMFDLYALVGPDKVMWGYTKNAIDNYFGDGKWTMFGKNWWRDSKKSKKCKA